MPTYEYRCKKCGHEFERLQRFSEKPVSKCPECGGKVERILGAGAGFIFKGSGFYETDYKRKREKTASTASTDKASKSSDSKSSTKDKS